MGKLDYNEITDNNQFSKSDVGLVCDAVNDNDTRISTIETQGGRDVTKYTYGACLRGFLKKCRDWKAGRYVSKAPTVAILGDSITAGIWTTTFRNHLVDTFDIPVDNIKIYAYGGYNPINFAPILDTELIESNPDLIFFNENEWLNPVGRQLDSYLHQIEQTIQKCRLHTTADILFGTWSMDGDVALDYYNGIDIYENIQYQLFNWYRDMGAKYHCEIVDFNQAILNHIDLGNDPTGHYTGVHWDPEWYEAVWTPEIIKHFNNNEWQASINQPYSNYKKEELLFLVDDFAWTKFKDSRIVLTGAWEYLKGQLKGFNTNTIEIDAKNIIGFEIIHGEDNVDAGKQYSIEIDDGTGYKSPSAMLPFGMLQEYATEIVSSTYTDQQEWRSKRMRKMAEITTSYGDNKTTSRRYTLLVTGVVDDPERQEVTFDVKDDTNAVIGTFNTADMTDCILPNFTLPVMWNGENNWQIPVADETFPAQSDFNFVVGEEYEFYTRSNWIDTVNVQNDKHAFVFGLEPKDYTIKITVDVAPVNFLAINLLHSL